MYSRLLALDPASGGTSFTGYALFENGRLVESGVVKVTKSHSIERRLFSLATFLRKRFSDVDCIAVEELPPYMSARGSSFMSKGVVHLHYSVGVILSIFGDKPIIRVTPRAWQSFVSKVWPEYEKSDVNDAIAIGLYALAKGGLVNEHNSHILSRRRSKACARTRSKRR